jgi:hypothetical protein
MEKSIYRTPLKLALRTAIIVILIVLIYFHLPQISVDNTAFFMIEVLSAPIFLIGMIGYPIIILINSQDYTKKIENEFKEGSITQEEYYKYHKERKIAIRIFWIGYTLLSISNVFFK